MAVGSQDFSAILVWSDEHKVSFQFFIPALCSGDAAAVTLKPTDVRLAPLWVSEEKSWRVTLIKVHIQEFPEVQPHSI